MNTEESKFQKGFNDGYLLSLHRPDLLDKIAHKLLPEDPYLNGLFSGKQQQEKEKAAPSLPSLDKQSEKSKQSPGKGIEHDKS